MCERRGMARVPRCGGWQGRGGGRHQARHLGAAGHWAAGAVDSAFGSACQPQKYTILRSMGLLCGCAGHASLCSRRRRPQQFYPECSALWHAARQVAPEAAVCLEAGYIGYVMLGSAAPGVPAFAAEAKDLEAVLHNRCRPRVLALAAMSVPRHYRGFRSKCVPHCSALPCSLNFFYVTPGLCAAGLSPLPCFVENPVDEALFNFVNAFSLMLGPLMFADPRARNVANKWPLWIGTMFLTNIFFIPFMALRAAPTAAAEDSQEPVEMPQWAPAVGWLAATVGVASVAWFIAARPGSPLSSLLHHLALLSFDISRAENSVLRCLSRVQRYGGTHIFLYQQRAVQADFLCICLRRSIIQHFPGCSHAQVSWDLAIFAFCGPGSLVDWQ